MLLLCSLSYSQEAERAGFEAGLTVIPRLDLSANSPVLAPGSDGSIYGGLGNSSLYTNFEASFSENLSLLVVSEWLCDDPSWLYGYTGHSDSNNWLNFCTLEYALDNWSFTVGKDCMLVGGYEFDPWDYDSHSELNSAFWNTFACYQWSGKVGYTTSDESTSIYAQMAASPFGEYPFASGLWAYSLQWKGEYGPFYNIWSWTLAEADKGQFENIVCLGQQLALGDFTIEANWFNILGWDDAGSDGEYRMYLPGRTITAGVTWAPSDAFDITAKYVLEGYKINGGGYGDYQKGGIVAQWYPIKDSQALRLHALVGAGENVGGACINIGATYYLDALNLFRK